MECPKEKRLVIADDCEECVTNRVCYEWCYDHIVWAHIGEPMFVHPMYKYGENLGKILEPPPKTEPQISPYTKQRIPNDLRWQIWERDNFTCQCCGGRKHLSIDHIYPECRGGQLTEENLQTLCKNCNSKKSTKT